MANVTTHTHHIISGEHSSHTSSDATPPNHLGTDVPSGHFDGAAAPPVIHDPEKTGHLEETHHDAPAAPPMKKESADDDEDDEDMDALIDELESQDGAVEEEEEVVEAGGARPVPEEMLNTDTRQGLSESEVTARRKKYGMNQMKEEKENLILKFLGYFVGPIQFVMEVSQICQIPARQAYFTQPPRLSANISSTLGRCCPCRGSRRLGRLWCYLRSVASQRHGWVCPGIPGRFHRRGVEENPRS